jgi:hypothetical protein
VSAESVSWWSPACGGSDSSVVEFFQFCRSLTLYFAAHVKVNLAGDSIKLFALLALGALVCAPFIDFCL